MIKLPAYLSGYSSRADNSLGLRFATQEVDSDVVSELQNLNGAFGYLVFSENPIQDVEIPTEGVEDKSKTPSKRIRAVLYRIFESKYPEKKDFETYYRMRMEKLIEKLKQEIV